ncbi:YncE family protein [Novosphingobium umbonatum]|nr:hypothetical protein [Novosphingobium umbonatum]
MRFMRSALMSASLVAATVPVAGVSAHASTIVMGSYPDKLLVVDETSGKVVDKIQLASGLPTALRLSNDKKRIYTTTITNSGIEVLDAATRKVLNSFSLNTPTTRYRFTGGVPDHTGRYYYTILMQFDKQVDRYKVGKWQYATIDLVQKKVVKAVDIPEDDNPLNAARANMMLSPDGKLLYIFRDKVLILNTSDFKTVDKIDMAKPEGAGLENNSFGGGVELLRNNDEYVSLFTAADPYLHNKIFGIGRFKLASKTFDFTPIGPAPYQMAGLQVTPDGKQAYTVVTQGTIGNKRCEFWHFDLSDNKVLNKAEFPCRSRFQFGMSTDGAKLYIYGASYDIEVYSAKTLAWEKTWNLEADATMAGMVYTP